MGVRALHIIAPLGLGAIGTGGWYGFSTLHPKNLKQYLEWQGFKLASYSHDNTWKSILEENKDLLSKIPELKDDNLPISKIRDWCYSRYGYTNFDDLKDSASKLCVDNPRTVKGSIIQKSGSIDALIKSDSSEAEKQYKVSFLFRKHIEGFKDLIGYSTPAPEKEGDAPKENLKDAYEKLKSWCDRSLLQKPTDSLISNVEIFCSPKKFKTIKELIQLNKETLLTDSSKSRELSDKHNKIKDLDSYKNDSSVTGDKTNEESLKTWCTTMENKEFSDDGVFEDYPKFRFRCVSTSAN
ncbi:hypothetical protein HF1_09870 [Mycoplasma haemofelis str. Langford 1]|uniref:Uncharacterized protein n=1 Tax=Mycoplasma haemofelis (strain Langford 1) TaxID=941640 RepID=E8ZIM4_MYCHL|nr:hypothetical protein [Mycoplasma haemofelis]CBY92995.1 hypothetical protein HF1_09870 [Mycoplasma haemofelis str. Langford 1]